LPLIKRIINLRTSKAITLPIEWLRWVKERYGDVQFVEVEIDDELRIRPHRGFTNESGGCRDNAGQN